MEPDEHLARAGRSQLELVHGERSADALEYGCSRLHARRVIAPPVAAVNDEALSWPAMRALVFTGAGGPEVMRLEERPDPVPGTGEVLVEQRFGGLNPADLLQRAGHRPAGRRTSPVSTLPAASSRWATR
jgi:hypothetical protein